MLWPAVTLLGFLLLTAFVIAMGTTSTARYEREKQAEEPAGAVDVPAESLGGIARAA